MKQDIMTNNLENIDNSFEEMTLSMDTALFVLNDMLTYDKLQTDPMRLKLQFVAPWPIISDTISSMSIQARSANVELCVISSDATHDSLNNYLIEADRDNTRKKTTTTSTGTTSTAMAAATVAATSASAISRVSMSSVFITTMTTTNSSVAVLPTHVSEALSYNMMRLKIVDYGMGLTKDEQDRILHDELQFSPGTLSQSGNTGFGLFITKTIVDAHGWSLSIHSEGESLGTTITLEIPMLLNQNHNTVLLDDNNNMPFVANMTADNTHTPRLQRLNYTNYMSTSGSTCKISSANVLNTKATLPLPSHYIGHAAMLSTKFGENVLNQLFGMNNDTTIPNRLNQILNSDYSRGGGLDNSNNNNNNNNNISPPSPLNLHPDPAVFLGGRVKRPLSVKLNERVKVNDQTNVEVEVEVQRPPCEDMHVSASLLSEKFFKNVLKSSEIANPTSSGKETTKSRTTAATYCSGSSSNIISNELNTMPFKYFARVKNEELNDYQVNLSALIVDDSAPTRRMLVRMLEKRYGLLDSKWSLVFATTLKDQFVVSIGSCKQALRALVHMRKPHFFNYSYI
eukprot:gene1650-3192_t